MFETGPNCSISPTVDKFDTPFADGGDSADVGKKERKDRVLAFLVDTGLALPRIALFRNLKYQGADFSDSSLQNYLAELREEGYVERIDANEFAKGRIILTDEDPGYWVATNDGREYVESTRSSDEEGVYIGQF